MLRLLKGRVFSGLTVSSDGRYLVVASRFKLHVVNIATGSDADLGALDEKDPLRFRTYLTTESLTCVAFHPTEGCIAAGDERGRITLWYCFGKNVDSPVTSVMHWHAHRVAALSFSADGTYLLSGGEESTLVIWQLNTGFKQFLPRLGSEIKHITISPDQSYYAVGLKDNSVSVIRSVDLQTKTVIQGLKFCMLLCCSSNRQLTVLFWALDQVELIFFFCNSILPPSPCQPHAQPIVNWTCN